MKAARLLLATAVACSGEGVSEIGTQTGFLVFAEDAGTGCVTPMSLRGGLPADVGRMVVQVVGEPDGQVVATRVVTREDLVARREVVITGVPEGRYRLQVTGCGADGAALWAGQSEVFSVHAAYKSAPIVHMRRAGALNCAGGKNQNPLQPKADGDGFYVAGRAGFQAGVVTPGGRVLVTGGFVSDEYQPTGDLLQAGRRVWEYHPATGVFTGVFSDSGERLMLAEPRAMHGAAALKTADAEWLVLAGGVASAVLGPKGPEGYPVKKAPLDNFQPVGAAVEVVRLPLKEGEGPSARSLAVSYGATLPSWAFSADGRTVALAGGQEAGTVSARVLLGTLDDAALSGTGHPAVRSGTLARKRFGASAVFLSTGQLVLVGGYDGAGPAGMEVVYPVGADSLETVAVDVALPDGVLATAFAQAAVVADDRTRAAILVFGGNPVVGGATAFQDVGAAHAFLLELDGDGQAYDPASARTRAVSGMGEWAARSYATLARAGDRLVLAGGFRSFRVEAGVAGCGTGGAVWGAFCFPRTVAAFGFDAGQAAIILDEDDEDAQSRLGVAAVALPGGGVLFQGGISGAGPRPSPLPADFDALLSTGVVWLAQDALDSSACQAGSGP